MNAGISASRRGRFELLGVWITTSAAGAATGEEKKKYENVNSERGRGRNTDDKDESDTTQQRQCVNRVCVAIEVSLQQ